ncbi:MAG: LysM peptidoglycan-binding domain-containing protein [Planctomycetota bacterium]|nr:LysM peptidoglycan-binding domain-containing protein [Planctomycetota bacterium]
MAKSAKLLLIGALALLFSIAVLLESGSAVKAPETLSTVELPSELAPGVSKISTDVVEPRALKNPTATIDGSLLPIPKKEKDTTPIEELLEEPRIPAPVVEAPQSPASVSSGPSSAKVEIPKEAPQKTAPKTYVVEKNDSYWLIAKKVYGDGSKWKRIYDANRDICPRPDDLHPGLKLTIPEEKETVAAMKGGSGTPSTAISVDPDTSTEPVPGKLYIVQKNDVLSVIAKKAYGKASLWRKILEANKDVLTDEWGVREGMKILIPKVSE